MEIEYKWDLAGAGAPVALDAAERISPFIRGVATTQMHASYYDTIDGDVSAARGGLRKRVEDGVAVCCLKLELQAEGARAAREEYELACDDMHEALESLPGVGAPREFCELLASKELVVICETEFSRRAFQLSVDEGEGFQAELAFDEGTLRREGREAEFREMELEYRSGSLEGFHAFAADVEKTGRLVAQPLSKLARAMAL